MDRVGIEAIEGRISFYIDDILQFERKDSNYTKGGIALVAYDAVVEFDNVIIDGP